DASFDPLYWDSMRAEDATVDVHVLDGSLASVRAPGRPLAHVRDLRLRASGSIELADPLRALTASITVPEADVPEHDVLAASLPKGSAMGIVTGHARFAVGCHVVIADHLARGTVDVRAPRLG